MAGDQARVDRDLLLRRGHNGQAIEALAHPGGDLQEDFSNLAGAERVGVLNLGGDQAVQILKEQDTRGMEGGGIEPLLELGHQYWDPVLCEFGTVDLYAVCTRQQ